MEGFEAWHRLFVHRETTLGPCPHQAPVKRCPKPNASKNHGSASLKEHPGLPKGPYYRHSTRTHLKNIPQKTASCHLAAISRTFPPFIKFISPSFGAFGFCSSRGKASKSRSSALQRGSQTSRRRPVRVKGWHLGPLKSGPAVW